MKDELFHFYSSSFLQISFFLLDFFFFPEIHSLLLSVCLFLYAKFTFPGMICVHFLLLLFFQMYIIYLFLLFFFLLLVWPLSVHSFRSKHRRDLLQVLSQFLPCVSHRLASLQIVVVVVVRANVVV